MDHDQKLLQFHFHWGVDNSVGSEHKINGRQFPLEVGKMNYESFIFLNIRQSISFGEKCFAFVAKTGERKKMKTI